MTNTYGINKILILLYKSYKKERVKVIDLENIFLEMITSNKGFLQLINAQTKFRELRESVTW